MPTTFPIYLRDDTGYAVRQRSIVTPTGGVLRLGWIFKGEPQPNQHGLEHCAAKLKVIANGTTLFSREDHGFGSFNFSGESSIPTDGGVQYDICMDRNGTHDIRDNVEIDFEITFLPS